ncbi:MAG: hypothetical protein NC131_20960 [Roseburia sp.]|nr:hypothetical protein [Roseburia sp.]
MEHYFAVEAKCGHVGKGKCIFIWFAIQAENGKAAATKAREYGRVKHHHKDAIRQVKEISDKEFVQLQINNNKDPYLRCKNIQQQRNINNLEDRIEIDKYILSKNKKSKSARDKSYLLRKNTIREKDAIRQMRESDYCDMAI